VDPRRQSSAPAHPTPSAKVLCREELLGLPEPDHGVCAKVRIADATSWIVETFGVVVSCCRSICFFPLPQVGTSPSTCLIAAEQETVKLPIEAIKEKWAISEELGI